MNFGPFLRSTNSTHKMMKNLFFSLIPIILFFIYKNGIIVFFNENKSFLTLIYPLLWIMLGSITSITTELIYFKYFKKEVNLDETLRKSYPIFQGLFLSLMIPMNTNILILILAVIITSISKIIMIHLNYKIINSVSIGFIIISLLFKLSFDLEFFNGTIEGYKIFKNSSNFWDYFIGISNYISPLFCILAYFYLSLKKAIKWKIPIIYILTVFLMCWIIGKSCNLDISYPLYAIFSGHLMFSAIFLATETFSSPMTPIGQIIYAIVIGIVSIIFRFLIPFNGGIMLSILFANLLAPILDKLGSYGSVAFKKIIIPLILCILISILLISEISKKYNLKYENIEIYEKVIVT